MIKIKNIYYLSLDVYILCNKR